MRRIDTASMPSASAIRIATDASSARPRRGLRAPGSDRVHRSSASRCAATRPSAAVALALVACNFASAAASLALAAAVFASIFACAAASLAPAFATLRGRLRVRRRELRLHLRLRGRRRAVDLLGDPIDRIASPTRT